MTLRCGLRAAVRSLSRWRGACNQFLSTLTLTR
jgi:hypothetical protein